MEDAASHCLNRLEFETDELVRRHPPRLHNANKRIVYGVACPPGCRHAGRLTVSRWRRMAPPAVLPAGRATQFEARAGYFTYDPPPTDGGVIEWHLNFADPHLFCAYGGPLFAQDEMQVAEHPALASLREALLRSELTPLTQEHLEPTPVLVRGVERRCAIATDPNADEDRPHGLYGNRFAASPPDAIRRATRAIIPPTVSNLIAMAAPACGSGTYTRAIIEYILATAFTGFAAARIESAAASSASPRVLVHTGFWGCGAFGGNRVLMTLVQMLAAALAGLDRAVFHTGPSPGEAAFAEAAQRFESLVQSDGTAELARVSAQIETMGFRWGVSDGN